MHHLQIKSAARKYSEMFKKDGPSVVKIKMMEDGFSEEDIDEVITFLHEKADKQVSETQNAPVSSNEINNIDAILAEIKKLDYNNLTYDQFAKYCELIQQLPTRMKFDFEVIRVKAIKEPRYEGVKDSPIDIVGIEISDPKPKHTTRIPPTIAIMQNGRVQWAKNKKFFEVIGAQFDQRGNGLFYFIKK